MPLTHHPGISEILPNRYRGVGLAWTELNLASWAIAGTLLANALLTHASWRVMFYIASELDFLPHGAAFIADVSVAQEQADRHPQWDMVDFLSWARSSCTFHRLILDLTARRN